MNEKVNIWIFQKYTVFKEINALVVLIPALLGLKGNLDMCLASRLCTQANLGNMKSLKEVYTMISGNLLLVQVWLFLLKNINSVDFEKITFKLIIKHYIFYFTDSTNE